jgi:hypothetical protein
MRKTKASSKSKKPRETGTLFLEEDGQNSALAILFLEEDGQSSALAILS